MLSSIAAGSAAGSAAGPAAAGPAAPWAVEHAFTLPRGYVAADGRVHRDGVLRPATALDEIEPQADPRVLRNPAYLTVALLARTVTRLGDLSPVGHEVVEGLYAADLAFLQDLYRRVNEHGHALADVTCPGCGLDFPVAVPG